MPKKIGSNPIPEHEMRPDMLTMLDAAPMSSNSKVTSPANTTQNRFTPEINTKSQRQNSRKKQMGRPVSNAGAAGAREDIVTASDISSVDLDSDDSCFAATVEVIKLAPVKKQMAENSEYA